MMSYVWTPCHTSDQELPRAEPIRANGEPGISRQRWVVHASLLALPRALRPHEPSGPGWPVGYDASEAVNLNAMYWCSLPTGTCASSGRSTTSTWVPSLAARDLSTSGS